MNIKNQMMKLILSCFYFIFFFCLHIGPLSSLVYSNDHSVFNGMIPWQEIYNSESPYLIINFRPNTQELKITTQEIDKTSIIKKITKRDRKENQETILPLKTARDLALIKHHLETYLNNTELTSELSDRLSILLYPDPDCLISSGVSPMNKAIYELYSSTNTIASTILDRIKNPIHTQKKPSLESIHIPVTDGYLDFEIITDSQSKIKTFKVDPITPNPNDYTVKNEKSSTIVRDKSDNLVLRVSKEDGFSDQNGGTLSVSTVNPDKTLNTKRYNIYKKNNKKWVLSLRNSSNNPINLSDDTDPDLQFVLLEQVITLPFFLVGTIFDSTIATFYINLRNSQKLIKNKIIEGASKGCIHIENDPQNSLLSKEKIEKIATEISENYNVKTQPLEKAFDINKETSLRFALEVFREQLVKLTGQPPTNELLESEAQNGIEDLKKCLGKSVKQQHIDQCVKSFSYSAPYRIGKSIINILGQEHFSALTSDVDKILKTAQKQYDQCMSEDFFIINMHPKERELLANEQKSKTKSCTPSEQEKQLKKVVQSCLYQGILKASNELADQEIKINLEQISNTTGKQYPLSQQSLGNIFDNCLREKSFLKKTSEYKEFNNKILENKDPELFKNEISNCAEHLKRRAGRAITDIYLQDEPRIIEQFKNANGQKNDIALDNFIKKVLSDGYDPCVNAQSVANPEECRFFIEQSAITNIVIKKIDTELEQAQTSDVLRKPIFSNLNSCLDQNNHFILKKINNTSLEQTDIVHFQNRALDCIKNSIKHTSGVIADSSLEKTINNDPRMKNLNIKINQNMKNTVAEAVRACFAKNLESFQTIDQLSDTKKFSDLTSKCTAEAEMAITPIIISSATNNILDEYIQKGTITQHQVDILLKAYSNKLSKQYNLKAPNQSNLTDVIKLALSKSYSKGPNSDKALDEFIKNYTTDLGELIVPYIVSSSITRTFKDLSEVPDSELVPLIESITPISQACIRLFNDQKNFYNIEGSIWKDLTQLRKKHKTIDTSAWQNQCENYLTQISGRKIVSLSLAYNPQLTSIFAKEGTRDLSKRKVEIIDEILQKSYDPCIQKMKKNNLPIKPENCRPDITAYSTALLMKEKINLELEDLFPTSNEKEKRPKFALTDHDIEQNRQRQLSLKEKIFKNEYEPEKIKNKIHLAFGPNIQNTDKEIDKIVKDFTNHSIENIATVVLDSKIAHFFEAECSENSPCPPKQIIIDELIKGKGSDQGLNKCLTNEENYQHCISRFSLQAAKTMADRGVSTSVLKLNLPKEDSLEISKQISEKFQQCINDINIKESDKTEVIIRNINQCQIQTTSHGLQTVLPLLAALENHIPYFSVLPKRFIDSWNKSIVTQLQNNISECTNKISKDEDFTVYTPLFDACIHFGINSTAINILNTIGDKTKILQASTKKLTTKILENEEKLIDQSFAQFQKPPQKRPYEKNRTPEHFLEAISHLPSIHVDANYSTEALAKDFNETIIEPVLNFFDNYYDTMAKHPHMISY